MVFASRSLGVHAVLSGLALAGVTLSWCIVAVDIVVDFVVADSVGSEFSYTDPPAGEMGVDENLKFGGRVVETSVPVSLQFAQSTDAVHTYD